MIQGAFCVSSNLTNPPPATIGLLHNTVMGRFYGHVLGHNSSTGTRLLLAFFRVHFKIWPGQFGLIETTFRQRVSCAMKAFDPNYADWQVPVTYRALAHLPR